MKRAGLVAVAWLGLAGGARADFMLCLPWVRVQVGHGGVYVQAPGVTVNVPRPPAVGAQPVLPLPRAVEPGPDVPPPPPAPAGAVVPTLSQFAQALVPQPGRHEAVVLHPATGRPVTVAFTLPAGTPRQIRVRRWRVVMDYGRHNVTIVFLRNGGVRVRD
jgi:hypothetical protein